MKKSTVPRLFIAAGLEESDVRYATGLVAPDPFVLMVKGNRLHLLVSALEASRALHVCPDAIVHTPGQLFGDSVPVSRSLSGQILALLHQQGCGEVDVGPHFPFGMARALEDAGVIVHLVKTPPFPSRAVKTTREIRAIAQSQRAAVAAMKAAIQILRMSSITPSGCLAVNGSILTSERIKLLIERSLLDHNCTATGTIVAVGPQGARPHDEGSGSLRAHVPVVIDIFPRHKQTGYWGDITRTVVRGRATSAVRKLHRTVRQAQQLALGMVRPGVESRAVQKAVEQYFVEAGYATILSPAGEESGFIHSVGHGLGLDVHESPGLRNEPGCLSAGNVLTVEPGLYIPGLGGVRIEDTVVVTPTGFKILATFPKMLEI
jgi:Xaa-Pro aminopeptidase